MKIVLSSSQAPYVFLFYWISLVLWQNFFGQNTLRSGLDLVIKIILIAVLSSFYLLFAKRMHRDILIKYSIFLFLGSITFLLNEIDPSLFVLVFYLFIALFIFLTYCLGNDIKVDTKTFITFLHVVIAVVLYASLYGVCFHTSEFFAALTARIAYGHEYSSFFISNHEFGMYLVYAITSCLFCVDNTAQAKNKKYYYIVILFFLLQLILTFSRTSLFALIVFYMVYILFSPRSREEKVRILCWFAVGGVLVLCAGLKDFLEMVLLKKTALNTEISSSRLRLLAFAVEFFSKSSLLHQLFGYGLTIRSYTETLIGHGSIHNAYLQILLYFGVAGLISLLIFLCSQLRTLLRTWRYAPHYASFFLAIFFSSLMIMLTNTAILFTSPIDAFFLTIYVFIVPKYVQNSLRSKHLLSQSER